MDIVYLFLVAFGLSADCFAVATTEGFLLKRSKHLHSLRVAVVFGCCQGSMPLLGWLLGTTVYDFVDPYADWAACMILVLIGGKMLYEAVGSGSEATAKGHSVGFKLWILGIAVSIDSFGAGLSLAMGGLRILTPAILIGLVTAVVCVGGVQLGGRIGRRAGKRAEVAGAVVLILIGLSFLV